MADGAIPEAASKDSYDDGKNPAAGVVTQATWKGKIWDTFDLPPRERKLLFKVDAFILIFASVSAGGTYLSGHARRSCQLGYFLKNIDQSNVKNAFVSGMKEELDMRGNQLVTATTLWTIGYVVGQIPTNLILTRVSPRYVIPFVRCIRLLSRRMMLTIAGAGLGYCYAGVIRCQELSGAVCLPFSRRTI